MPLNLRTLERSFDLYEYLKKQTDPKQYGGEVAIECPVCFKAQKLWVLVEDKPAKRRGQWICYYCDRGGSTITSLIRYVEGCNLISAIHVLREGSTHTDLTLTRPLRDIVEQALAGLETRKRLWDDTALTDMPLPESFQPVRVGQKAPAYLRERGRS
jgi:hypothetical protein